MVSPVQASYLMAVLTPPLGLIAGFWLLSRRDRNGLYVVAMSVIAGLLWLVLIIS